MTVKLEKVFLVRGFRFIYADVGLIYLHISFTSCYPPKWNKYFVDWLQPVEIIIDDESKLTLHGLQQYYIQMEENEKSRKICDLLDLLEFNQVAYIIDWVLNCSY